MKKLVSEEVENEGLDALLGEQVLLLVSVLLTQVFHLWPVTLI